MVQTDSEEQRQKGNKDKVEKQEGQQEQMQNTCCRIKTNENRQKNIVCVIGMSLLRGFLFALCFLLSGCLDLTMLLVPMIPVFCKPNWSALWTWLGLQFTVVNLSRERFDLWAELIVDSAMKTNRNPWLVGCFIQGVVLHHFIEIAISHDFRVLRCQDGSWFRLMFFCCRPVQAGPALWILHGFATGHPCAWMVTPWSVGCVVSGIYGWIQEWYCWWTLYPITTSGYGKLSREWTRPVDEPKSVIPLSTKQSLDDLDLRIWHFFIPLPEPRKKYEVDWAVYPGWILLGLVGTIVCPSKREIPSWINQYDSWGQSTWLGVEKCKLDLLEKIARITSDDMDIVFLTSGMAWKFVVRCHDDLRMFDSVKTKHDKLDDSTTVFFSYSSDIPWFNISISAICFLLRSCFKPKSEAIKTARVGLDRLEKKWGLQLKGAVRYFHCTCGLFSFNPMSLQPLEPCSFHKEVGAMYCFLGLSFWAPNLKTAAKSVASVGPR